MDSDVPKSLEQQPAQPLVVTIDEAAEMAGISRAHLYELIREGRGPRTILLGRRRVLRREAVAQWLADCESGVTPHAVPLYPSEDEQ